MMFKAHVLATGGLLDGVKTTVSLDSFHTIGIADITDTPRDEYLNSPSQVVVEITGNEAELNAVAAAPGNTELFRDELPQEII